MPALSNPRHERFAQAIYQCMAIEGAGMPRPYSQAAAYKAAGYNVTNGNSARSCASRLLTFANGIAERLAELQAEHARRKAVTVDSIVDELEEARTIAREEKQTGAMVQASSTKAKLFGMFVDKHEHGAVGSFDETNNTSELAETLLREANPALGIVDSDRLAMALAELARHADTMAAIAHGDRLAIAQ